MDRSIRVAVVVGGALALLGTATVAESQRPLPRAGVTLPPRPPRPIGHAGEDPRTRRQVGDPRVPQSANDPRHAGRDPAWEDRRRQHPRNDGRTVIILPVPGDYGYGYSQGAYYPGRAYGGVYDANGRPLSSSLQQVAPAEGHAYTPDLSGSPYAVTDEGMMVVDFADRPRRAFPSCAGQSSVRDPDGRPRTIFYQPTDYWMVLRPGQRGRVQGAPPAGAAACYAIDEVGRVVLRH